MEPAVLSRHLRLTRTVALAALLLCFGVVVLGGYVRVTAAGLGCPDWPGCYGHVTPATVQAGDVAAHAGKPLEVGKAWREMGHRYAAGTLATLILALAALLLTDRRARLGNKVLGAALAGIVLMQAVLGALTVTWQVTPPIVTLHLLFGLTTLALLWWLWLSLPVDAWKMSAGTSARLGGSADALRTARLLAVAGLAVLCMQIALGGWTSTNYAAIACPDFPTCQNAFWPKADWRAGFVVWRGLGVNYEGGVLDNAARVAIHFTHRLGALCASLALLAAAAYVLLRGPAGPAPAAWGVLAALAFQLVVGVSMVLWHFPVALATLHTAGAALLLLAALALVRRLRGT